MFKCCICIINALVDVPSLVTGLIGYWHSCRLPFIHLSYLRDNDKFGPPPPSLPLVTIRNLLALCGTQNGMHALADAFFRIYGLS
jgi:hypothetical protein